jgi:2-polyprenyl-3-methyl-5-hydroxy-6-metoxy-1,4-benzoquinol methylase
MDEKYWDRVARDYDGEIFDSLASNRNGAILRHLKNFGDGKGKPGGTAFDFGCGVGKYVPTLAKRFAKVHAADISAECIRQARAAHAGLKNVAFHKGDLSRAGASAGKVDFALCTNVLIMPSAAMRAGILRRLANTVRPGGGLLLLVPALESALYAHARRAEWLQRSPGARVIASTTFTGVAGRDIFNGIIAINGVRTKHWLLEELETVLAAAGFKITARDKAEYEWSTEFAKPPRWMKDPYPWDWLVAARRDG